MTPITHTPIGELVEAQRHRTNLLDEVLSCPLGLAAV